jgi:hypothetical protein
MLFGGAVAEIQAKDVHTGCDQFGNHVVRLTGGANGGDYFRTSDELWVHSDSGCGLCCKTSGSRGVMMPLLAAELEWPKRG